jgi:protein-disulfide isomerase
VVTANLLLGQQLGVSGTPTVILDTGEGRPVWVRSDNLGGLRDILNEALGRLGEEDA